MFSPQTTVPQDAPSPSVDDIILDGVEAGSLPVPEDMSRAEHPGAMADGSYWLPRLAGSPNQVHKTLVSAPVVWRKTSRDDQSVNIL